jgi:hypothetical protein
MNHSYILFLGCLLLMGCQNTAGNAGRVQSYNFVPVEAQWIRDGDPIEFENVLWHPADEIESLLDTEMYLLGEYRGIQFFAEKTDVRPFNRLYTKFDRNKFRFFEKSKKIND